MRSVGIIPARFASQRLPGKPLRLIGGQSLVGRVYHSASLASSLDHLIVATDDERIAEHLTAENIPFVLTSKSHLSGTDRCAEALQSLPSKPEIVVNIQGDEPFIAAAQIDQLVAAFTDPKVDIATLCKKRMTMDDFANPNTVKVVRRSDGFALFFSRAGIPYDRNTITHAPMQWLQHIGMYAYRGDVLETLASLQASELEQIESLEQLRWLENGFAIKMVETEISTFGVDTEDDLQRAESIIQNI